MKARVNTFKKVFTLVFTVSHPLLLISVPVFVYDQHLKPADPLTCCESLQYQFGSECDSQYHTVVSHKVGRDLTGPYLDLRFITQEIESCTNTNSTLSSLQ
jgi:hypothetical protein